MTGLEFLQGRPWGGSALESSLYWTKALVRAVKVHSHFVAGLIPVRGRCREESALQALYVSDVGSYVDYVSP